jgi:hypothetical protein
MPVKYRCDLKRWVFDWNGVSEAEAAKHCYIPKPVAPLPRVDRAYVRLRAEAKAAATWAAKRAAKAKAAKKAAAKERARARQRAYQAGYYLRVTKPRRAERRSLLRNAPG